jgi:PAS domain S-box-containing protein
VNRTHLAGETSVRILHVDDDPDYLALAGEFLERTEGFEVISETDPDAAIDRIEAAAVDCVVSDFDMPARDGLEFLADVRAADPSLPFILHTGKGSEEIASEAISAGVTDYVQKGGRQQYDVLANRIENAVERSVATARSRETTRRLHETFERIEESFLAVDGDWEITYVNDRGAEFLKASRGDLRGRDLRSLVPCDGSGFLDECERVLRTGEPMSFETESAVRRGQWLAVRIYPANDGLSIYWRDETRRRRRERVLAELHRGARDLLGCETTETVCAQGVELVESVLGFETASVSLLGGDRESDAETGVRRIGGPASCAGEDAGSTGDGDEDGDRTPPTPDRAAVEALAGDDEPVVVTDRTDAAAAVPAAPEAVPPGVYLPFGDGGLLAARAVPDRLEGIDEFDRHCLRLLATRLEAALRRARRERELAASRDLIRGLHDSVMGFQDCDDPESVFAVGLRSAREAVDFDYCRFARSQADGLVTVAEAGDWPGDGDVTTTTAGAAARTGDAVRSARADAVAPGESVGSSLAVPVEDWGVLEVVSGRPGAFDATDRELLDLLSMHVRAALSRVESTRGLRRERDRLDAFFRSSGEPVVRVRFADGDARIDRVNPAFERVFGVDGGEVRGDPLADHVVPPAGRERTDGFAEQSGTGDPVEAEVRRLTADGEREFLFRSAPFRGEDDRPMAYGIYVDVTARTRRERELERYRTIVESTGDPVYTLDADGRITYVNEALESMTGYDAETLVGEHMRLLVTESGVERSERLIRDLLADGGRTNDTVEHDIVCADGTRVRCENHIALLPADDGFAGTAGALRDVTARKERERELERKNERLEGFASVVSHDLRNPLQVARGNLDRARGRLDDESGRLRQVDEALDRIDAIVDDVLTLAREGTDLADPSTVSVADTAHSAWESVDTRGCRLSVETDLTVDADETRLQRLFENLFRNAVEHGSTSPRSHPHEDAAEGASASGARAGEPVEPAPTPSRRDDEGSGTTGGEPTARDGGGSAVRVRVGDDAEEGADATAFFVEDDGPGVPVGERERVFETGYSTSEAGTGFGLDIVETIAAAHGWAVGLDDGDLGGARVRVSLDPGDAES